MTTRFSFTANENLKNKALAKAKREGITLERLFDYVMRGFVDGKISFELRMTEKGGKTPPQILNI